MFVLAALLVLILSFLTICTYRENVKNLVDQVISVTTASVTSEDASPKKPISVNYHFTRKVSNFI